MFQGHGVGRGVTSRPYYGAISKNCDCRGKPMRVGGALAESVDEGIDRAAGAGRKGNTWRGSPHRRPPEPGNTSQILKL